MRRISGIFLALIGLGLGVFLLPALSRPEEKRAERKVEAKEEEAVNPVPPRQAGEGVVPVSTSRDVLRLLKIPVETKGLQEKVNLKTALEYFSDKFGGQLPILVDKVAFATELGADANDLYEEEVVLPPVPSKMLMGTALRLILSQVGQGRATYVIRHGVIEIVPDSHTTSAYFLYQTMIGGSHDKRPLSEVLQDLSDESGVAIDLDPSVAKQASTPITTTFRNCSLEDALTPITEMAQLKYVVLNRSIYVTTRENAKLIEADEKVRREKREGPARKIIQQGKRLEAPAE